MNILITGACGVTPRAIARSIARSQRLTDVKLVGTDLCQSLYGVYEGLYHKVYRVPPARETSYPAVMARICGDERIDLAVVSPEAEVLFWSQNSLPVPVLLPPAKFCQVAISKRRLYEALKDTGLVPSFEIIRQDEILDDSRHRERSFPLWARDYREASSSGRGSMRIESWEAMKAWALLNRDIEAFMVSELLPGRNFACCMLFESGSLRKVASYERLEYFMARVVMSGISGNIARGRLINNAQVRSVSERAVQALCQQTGEVMHGLVTVDLKEDRSGAPLVTEINLRHVAATSAFADGGVNMAEAQVLATQGRFDLLGEVEPHFPEDNLILRDIDGLPLVVMHPRELLIGESFP